MDKNTKSEEIFIVFVFNIKQKADKTKTTMMEDRETVKKINNKT
jgi:hypothetical protein